MKVIFDFNGAKKRVKDFASVLGGYAFSSDQYTENGSHQIVRIGNVRDGYLDLSRAPVRWDFQDGDRSQKYELKEGDILISMTGTRNKRDYGYVAIVPSGQKLLLNQRVGKIVLHETLDRQYLYYFLRSPFFRDNLFPHATGTANQANIGNKHIEDVPFEPLESLEEQRRIVAYLDGLQAKIKGFKQLQAQTDIEFNALMPSILDKAFKGEL
jgi:type I restriction enzyme S subunit